MKGRVQTKNGYWYVVIERGAGLTPIWRKTGLKEKNNKRRAESMVDQIIAEYEAANQSLDNAPNEQRYETHSLKQAVVSEALPPRRIAYSTETIQTTESPSLSEVLRRYLSVARIAVKGNTYEKYRIAADTHIIPYFDALGKHISEIETSDLQDYIACKIDLLEKSTLKAHKTVLNQTFMYAIRSLRLIRDNPMTGVVLGKTADRVVNYYTADQINALLKRISNEGNQIAVPVILAACYGMRRQEILGLQ